MDMMTKIVIVFAVVFILSMFILMQVRIIKEDRQRRKNEYGEVDERQKLLRGKGAKIGFVTFVICSVILAMLKDFGIFGFGLNLIDVSCSLCVSISAMMTYLIWKDADLTPKRQKKSPHWGYTVTFQIGVLCMLVCVIYICTNQFTQNDYFLLFLGILMVYVGGMHFVKSAYDKKRKKNIDDEDDVKDKTEEKSLIKEILVPYIGGLDFEKPEKNKNRRKISDYKLEIATNEKSEGE